MSPNHVTSALVGQAIGFAWYNKSGYLLRDKPQHSEVVEAVDPTKWAPTPSLWNTNKVFYYNLHMQLMCICMSPNHVASALVGQAFGMYIQIYLPPEGQTTALSELVEVVDPFKWASPSLWNWNMLWVVLLYSDMCTWIVCTRYVSAILTSMYNWIQARLPATMVAETASIAVGGSQ